MERHDKLFLNFEVPSQILCKAIRRHKYEQMETERKKEIWGRINKQKNYSRDRSGTKIMGGGRR